MRYHVLPFAKDTWRVREGAKMLAVSLLAGLVAFFGSLPAGQAFAAIGDVCPTLFTEYTVPTPNSNPFRMTDDDGNGVWFSELVGGNDIGHITNDGTIAEYPVPLGSVGDIVRGDQGNLWFTTVDGSMGYVGFMNAQGAITTYELGLYHYGNSIVSDSNGGVWVSAGNAGQGGQISHFSSAGQRTDYPLSQLPQTAGPVALTFGSDGALWFLYEGADTSYPDGTSVSLGVGVGRMTTAGQTTLYPLSNVPRSLQAITAGPDGALWFTEYRTHQIGRITTSGQITEYTLGDQALPFDIKTSPNGELWASDVGVGEGLMRINTSQFYIDHFYIPSTGPASREIAFSGSNVWIAEQQTGKIARMTAPTGSVFAAPANLTAPNPTSQPNLSWDAPAGAANYIICRDGVQAATSVTPSYVDTSNLAAGEHVYSVVAVDAQGQLSAASAPITLLVDTTRPTIGSVTLSNNPLLIGSSTTVRAQGVTGAASVSYSVNGGQPVAMTYSYQTHDWTASFGSNLPVDTYDIEVVATSNTGLKSDPANTILAVYNPANGYVTGASQILPDGNDILPIPLDTGNKPAKVEFGFTNVKAPTGTTPATGSFDIQYKIKNKQNEFSLSDTAVNWLVVPDDNHASIQGKATLTIYQNGLQTVHPNVTVRFDVTLGTGGGPDTVNINIYDTGVTPNGAGTWVVAGETTGNSNIRIKP